MPTRIILTEWAAHSDSSSSSSAKTITTIVIWAVVMSPFAAETGQNSQISAAYVELNDKDVKKPLEL